MSVAAVAHAAAHLAATHLAVVAHAAAHLAVVAERAAVAEAVTVAAVMAAVMAAVTNKPMSYNETILAAHCFRPGDGGA